MRWPYITEERHPEEKCVETNQPDHGELPALLPCWLLSDQEGIGTFTRQQSKRQHHCVNSTIVAADNDGLFHREAT